MDRHSERRDRGGPEQGYLASRPRPTVTRGAEPQGLRPLALGRRRDGLLYAPSLDQADRPAPLLLLLHGAGGEARDIVAPLMGIADAAGVIIVAPDSRGVTWDVIHGGYGPDVAFIDQALDATFARYAIDPRRLAIGGFSDGASYALSLGLTNGALFTHVIAFSPGFMAPAAQEDQPRFFIAHGTADPVLPITACSRRLVPMLETAGYDVDYREFDGGHTVPPEIARAAVDWLGG